MRQQTRKTLMDFAQTPQLQVQRSSVAFRRSARPASVIVSSALGILVSVYLQTSNVRLRARLGGSVLAAELDINTAIPLDEYLRLVQDSGNHASISEQCLSFQQDLQLSIAHNDESCALGLDSSDHGANHLLVVCHLTLDEPRGLVVAELTATTSSQNSSPWGQRFLDQLCHIVPQMPGVEGSKDLPLDGLDFISPKDARDISQWNRRLPLASEIPRQCIHDAFIQRVKAHPHAEAISSTDTSLTYDELDQLSTRLTITLRALNLEPGSRIALCFEKSAWAIVCMLGVLKAGCAFALLDVSNPPERLRLLVDEINARLILTSESQQSRITAALSPRQVLVASNVSRAAFNAHAVSHQQQQQQVQVQEQMASPADLAVIVFTSGTTGKPKAVAMEHQSVCCTLQEMASLFRLGPGSRMLQFSSYAWDAAYGEIMLALLSGGCICVASDHERLNALEAFIGHQGVNTALLTPTVVRLLSPERVPSLRKLIVGGERVTEDLIREWHNRVELIGAYGPAECTVACVIKKGLRPGLGSVMGTPLACCRVWVALPRHASKLAPVGAVGELMVEGINVARGYLNNASATGRVFFTPTDEWLPKWPTGPDDKFGCYRTGDLVRYNSDGELVFVGRRDGQVKINSQRVELEEVQAQLQQNIPDSLLAKVFVDVVTASDSDRRQSLAAFVHLHERPGRSPPDQNGTGNILSRTETEAPVSHPLHQQGFHELVSKLESKAREDLPEFMVPTYWVKLDHVPLTPTGKLDRRKLKMIGRQHVQQHSLDALQGQRGGQRGGQQPALTTAQARLADMWQQVLRLPAHAIGPDSDFFRLGGNSFLTMELVSLSRRHRLALSVGDVLKLPKLSDLAPVVELVREQGQQSEIGAFTLVDKNQIAGLLSYLKDELQYDESMFEDLLPCTPLQQGLLASASSMYMSQFTISVPLGAEEKEGKIRAAWEMTVDETPILRTRILATPWGLMQAVFRGPLAWSISTTEDLSSVLKAEQEVATFGTNTPLARCCLAMDPVTRQGHLVLTLHHAVFDGWSLSAIVSTLQSHLDGSRSPAPGGVGVAKFNTFVDHVQRLSDSSSSKSYWSEQLAGVPAPSFLTGTSKHQPVDSACHNLTTHISGNQSLTILARAAWALLLAEYSGTDDVVFGNTLHGRNSLSAAMQHVLGPTLTTLPIRVNLHGIQTISQLLESLKNQHDAMIPFEQYGLLRIRDIDSEIRSAAAFQSLLIIQAEATTSEPGSYFELTEVTRNLHEYPLVITLTPNASATDVSWTFDELVISPQQVQRIALQLEHLMKQLCTLPGPTKLTELDMLSSSDAACLFAWNAHRPQVSHESALHVIKRQMEKSPLASAVEAWDGQLDYTTLDRLSDTLATKLLLGKDVTPGTFVGLCFEKSYWVPVSMLAVMKAGCVFLPLPPQAPRLRLEAIMRETGATIILCSPQLEDMLTGGPWTTIVVDKGRQVPEDGNNFGPTPLVPHLHATEPSSLLYALHTSGTTGTPKTFAISNSSFVTGALARAPLIRRGPESRVLQFSPFSFDPSIEDVLTTLMFGGCICLPSQDELLNDLSGFMRRYRVNFANITPSVAHTLETDLPDLKYLLLSGEAPNETLINRWRGRVQLVNGYGPSECSVKCCLNCNLQTTDAKNIGRAIGSAALWAVRPSNHHQLSPLGAVGELIIESPTLAQGYINNPQETAKRFVESPQWLQSFRGGQGSAPAMVYKTGDLVKFNMDGTISFLKRGDSELKLRGQRFEAEEVVQHIQRYFSGRQYYTYVDLATAAAEPDEKGSSTTILVAYIAQQRTFSTGRIELDMALQEYLARERPNIKKQLAASLPGFMIPSVFVGISAVPVTINGKVNRTTLANEFSRHASWILRSAASKTGPTSPLSENAELLRRLWNKVLDFNLRDCDAGSNFFDLGGSSLSAIKIVSMARDVGLSLSVRDILQNPVLGSLAAMTKKAEAMKNTSTSTTTVPYSLLARTGCTLVDFRETLTRYDIAESDVEDAYPCARRQGNLFESAIVSPGSTTVQHTITLPTDIDLDRLEIALRRVVGSTKILRSRVIRVSGQLIQVVCKDNEAVPIGRVGTQLAALDEAESHSWGLGDALSRFTMVTGSDDCPDRFLVWTANHAVWDGWFRRQLQQDMDYSYHYDCPPPSRPQMDQFIRHVLEDRFPSDLSSLANSLRNQHFPTIFQSQATPQTPSLHRILDQGGVSLPPTLNTGSLTLASIMLAAWSYVAATIESSDKFLSTVLVSGRDASLPGIETLMGPTSTSVPLDVSFQSPSSSSTTTFRGLASNVQNRLLDMSVIQHVYEFDTQLQDIVESAPLVGVYPAEEYEESPTEHLGMLRTKVTLLRPQALPVFIKFVIWKENTGFDVQVLFDELWLDERKAVRYLGGIKSVLMRALLSPGGLDTRLEDYEVAW